MLSVLFFEQVTNEDNRLAMPKVNQEQLNNVLVLVPPLAGQSRIVTKVNQHMTLCDELEADIQAHDTKARRFAEAVVAELAA